MCRDGEYCYMLFITAANIKRFDDGETGRVLYLVLPDARIK